MQGHKILHILLTDYKIDSRVRNITEGLVSTGYNVDVFCLKSADTQAIEYRNGVRILRYGIGSNKIINILTAYCQFILNACKGNYKLVHAHDFTALPVGLIISRLKRIPLIYDSHELWSESEHGNYPGWVFKIAYRIEKVCARRADYIITVSDSIRDYLRDYFGNVRIETVRNIPSYTQRETANLNNLSRNVENYIPTFIYAGSIDKKRGLYTILDALNLIRDLEYRFVFLVDLHTIDGMAGLIKKYDLESCVQIVRSVPQDELIQYLLSADVGIHAIWNTCLNHEYCLPNKIFEYINAGIVVLCTDVKEMSLLVHANNIGMTFKSGNANDLAEKMKLLISDKSKINTFKSNAEKLSRSLSWENEYVKLKKIYEDLIKN